MFQTYAPASNCHGYPAEKRTIVSFQELRKTVTAKPKQNFGDEAALGHFEVDASYWRGDKHVE